MQAQMLSLYFIHNVVDIYVTYASNLNKQVLTVVGLRI